MRFQHTAARRRLERLQIQLCHGYGFNTQPPEGGWEQGDNSSPWVRFVSTHSRPKAAGNSPRASGRLYVVSTHSRPKAAGSSLIFMAIISLCFNTQPPEGGWVIIDIHGYNIALFQHTAARRRLAQRSNIHGLHHCVSTHSRPKAAGRDYWKDRALKAVSTHSRPKAAGSSQRAASGTSLVSTHSRPKAAGVIAARVTDKGIVSTHSRPKAAGYRCLPLIPISTRFNTQPPEGGWPE